MRLRHVLRCATWITVLLTMVLAALIIHSWVAPLGAFPELGVAAVLVAAWLGLPKLTDIKMRALIRRGCRKSTRSPFALCLHVATTALVAAGFLLATYWTFDHAWYTHLMKSALTESGTASQEYLWNAFAFLPWRREAQIAIERQAMGARYDDDAFRRYVTAFTTNMAVTSSLQRAGDHPPTSLLCCETYVRDPVVWFAGILVEASGKTNTGEVIARAQQLLKNRHTPDAGFLRTYLALETDPEERLELDTREIETMLQHSTLSPDFTLLAFDVLGTAALIDANFEPAWRFYHKEIAYRARVGEALNDRLVRPPHKLLLYHLFMACDKEPDDASAGTARVQAIRAYCSQKQSACVERFKQHFCCTNCTDRAYRLPDSWKAGTYEEITDIQKYFLETTLPSGWRL